MKSRTSFNGMMIGIAICMFAALPVAFAQNINPVPLQDQPLNNAYGPLIYIVPLGTQTSTLYFDDSDIEINLEERWRPMCGSNRANITLADLQAIAADTHAAFENGPAIVIDNTRGGGLNLVYNCDASVPTEALSAIPVAEAYLESLFSNNITVTIGVRFDSLPSGVLGATNSVYINNLPFSVSRGGLQYGMDGDDVVQNYLPAGNTCPVRYNGSTTTVTNENLINWTKANYKSTVGSSDGSDASMVYDTGTLWDYSPENGIVFTRISFVDTVCHETGHALGFVSAVDNDNNTMETLDIFRFCRQDGTGDYNPDTYAEFQTTPRIVDFNNPNDQQNVDFISVEYRMEDGDPYQASHLRQANDYGCMEPAISNGSTRYPNYFTQVDIDCFDAIGWQYPPCDSPSFTLQPTPTQTVCAGQDVTLEVAVNVPSASYQWRQGGQDLVDDGVHITGATTASLTILGVTLDDIASNYYCAVRNLADDCPAFSSTAEILVDTDSPIFAQHPADAEVTEGEFVTFTVQLQNSTFVDYQWYHGATPMSDGARVSGATSSFLLIYPTQLSDAGEYTCVATSQLGMLCAVESDPATLTVNPNGQGCPSPGASGNYCTGDIDGSDDCMVGIADLAQLLSNYGIASGATHEQGDIEPPGGGDGDVDLSDLAALLSQYGDNCN